MKLHHAERDGYERLHHAERDGYEHTGQDTRSYFEGVCMTDCVPDELTFEEALAELEGIVRGLEDGQTGLEESLARYEKGVGLLKRCYGQLCEAEQRIMLLAGV